AWARSAAPHQRPRHCQQRSSGDQAGSDAIEPILRQGSVGGDPADASWHRDASRAFKALMHRFVDDGWLTRHGWEQKETAPE
ncbi:MAG: hypothetical protein ACKOHG_18370, partial [Planctomycetia bacterium]